VKSSRRRRSPPSPIAAVADRLAVAETLGRGRGGGVWIGMGVWMGKFYFGK
jgi:hypothetical protein